MKHKAQEALEQIDTDDKMYLIGHSKGYNKLKSLIVIQFDDRELNMIANCISVACFNGEVANLIMDKLIKQKEMWEEE